MSTAPNPEPIQPELPLEIPEGTFRPDVPGPVLRLPGLAHARSHPQVEEAKRRLSAIPWQPLGRAGLAVAIYLVRVAGATARLKSLPRAFRLVAIALHVAGYPAVVMRTSIQLIAARRAGLEVEEVVFFRVDDPAGLVAHETPTRIGTAAAIAFAPTAVLLLLAVIALAPATVPRSLLHLPTTIFTWLQLWLGLGFATHALPDFAEAAPFAEQTRAGARQADPISLLWLIPAHLTALVSRLGALGPAVVGSLLAIWLSRALFPG